MYTPVMLRNPISATDTGQGFTDVMKYDELKRTVELKDLLVRKEFTYVMNRYTNSLIDNVIKLMLYNGIVSK